MSHVHPDPSEEYCDENGAKILAKTIEAYWAARGYKVQIVYRDAGFVSAMRSARTDVRSNMVNGLPTVRADDQSEAA